MEVPVSAAVCICKNRAQENSTKTEPNLGVLFLSPWAQAQENSAKIHSKLQFLTRKNVKPIGRHEITYYAGRETHGVARGGVPHASGQDRGGDALLRVRVAAGGCCA